MKIIFPKRRASLWGNCMGYAGLISGTLICALLLLIISPALSDAFEVAIVKSSDIKPYNDALEGFRKSCKCKVTEVSDDSSNGVIRKIIGNSPDAVLAVGTEAFRKVKALKDLPVIYTMVMPSEVNNLRQTNISGVSMDVSPEASVRTLADVFPERKRIGLIYDPKYTGAYVKEIAESAAKEGLKIIAESIRNTSDVPNVLKEMEGKIDLFWLLPDATVVTTESVQSVMLFSFRNNAPVFTFSRKYVEMGAVCSLSINPFDMGVRAGELAAALSEGKRSPIKTYAKKTVLTINGKVATKMFIHIGNEIIGRAEVIE